MTGTKCAQHVYEESGIWTARCGAKTGGEARRLQLAVRRTRHCVAHGGERKRKNYVGSETTP